MTAGLSLALVLAIGTTARAQFDLETKLTASDAVGGDFFGNRSVAISGNTAVVGAEGDNGDDSGNENGSGSAYLFDVTTGNQLFKRTATDAAAGDRFGVGVGISGRTAIVGASLNDDAGSDSGSAYLFTSSSPLSDLTGNGFVVFEDLTVLLANWNQDVGAELGNLVERDTTPVNFADLTVLLSDWTGPGPVGSPEAELGTAAIPEPSSLLLALLAALGLSVRCWRRRRLATVDYALAQQNPRDATADDDSAITNSIRTRLHT